MRLCLVQCLVTRWKPEVKRNDTPCKLSELRAPCCTLSSPNDNLSSWPAFTAACKCSLPGLGPASSLTFPFFCHEQGLSEKRHNFAPISPELNWVGLKGRVQKEPTKNGPAMFLAKVKCDEKKDGGQWFPRKKQQDKCCFNGWLASQTLDHHLINTGSMSCVCWVCLRRWLNIKATFGQRPVVMLYNSNT